MSDKLALEYQVPAPRSARSRWLLISVSVALAAGLLGIASLFVPRGILPQPHENYAVTQSVSNMRQIGLGLRMYAAESSGAFPPDLATLAATQDLPAGVFIAMRSQLDRAAPDPDGKWAHKIVPSGPHCSYVYAYRPDFTDQMPASTVVLYEPPSINPDGGANVLYADGHTNWLDAKTAKAVIDQVAAGINPPK
ncbi:MAG TPA: hypothetical protein VF624_16185 [Tepidisphaeraceae bacterium]|jgi:prepilin-type processing-associated H-X9-DG protein